MKITIERTSKVVNAYGVPMHVWEGKTESGMRVACLVDHFMVESEDRLPQLDEEMKITKAPSAAVVAAFPDVVQLTPSQQPSSSSRRTRARERRRNA